MADHPDHDRRDDADNVVDFVSFRRKVLAKRAQANASAGRRAAKPPLALLTPPPTRRTYRIRVDLVGAEPAIWRRLALPADTTLDLLHRVLQCAFGWTESHLHRFTPVGDRHDPEAESILTPFDVEEGEQGVLESALRLDQLIAAVGDRLFYLYDFGDEWEHTLVLEGVDEHGPADAAAGAAASGYGGICCLDAGRKGPVEDVGGIGRHDVLVRLALDPTHREYGSVRHELIALGLYERGDETNADEVNSELDRLANADRVREWVHAHTGSGFAPSPLSELLEDLDAPSRHTLATVLTTGRLTEPVEIDEPDAAIATAVLRSFLEMVGDDGIRLTDDGKLSTDSLHTMMAVLDAERVWGGDPDHEVSLHPLLEVRRTAAALGLVRTHRKHLRPTALGLELRSTPIALWHHIARELPVERSRRKHDVALLLLALVASETEDEPPNFGKSLNSLASIVGWTPGQRPYVDDSAILAAARTQNVLSWAGTGVYFGSRAKVGGLLTAGSRQLARAALATWR